MGEQKNTIILNGKSFDTKTGSFISDITKPTKQNPVGHKVKSLEGFIRQGSRSKQPPAAPTISGHAVQVTIPSSRPGPSAIAAHKVHSRRQHAKTLVRPGTSYSAHPRPVAVAGLVEPSPQVAINDLPPMSLNSQHILQRNERAKSIPKSNRISRFYLSDKEPVTIKKYSKVHAKAEPAKSAFYRAPAPIAQPPVAETANSLFASALSRATSHEQLAHKALPKRHRIATKLGIKPRAVNIGASVLIVLVLVGFIAYQNMANMALRVAVARSGVSASLPSWRPSGFSLNRNIMATPGQVVIDFRSNSDSRMFTITQSSSDWNSHTLLDNFVVTTNQPYQKIDQNNGRTLYLYGNDNATWVDGGIWYKLESTANLSNDQLLNIANSF